MVSPSTKDPVVGEEVILVTYGASVSITTEETVAEERLLYPSTV
jgi:hypothetical protein